MGSERSFLGCFFLAIWLGVASPALAAQGRGKPMPTASLPLEPATQDLGDFDDQQTAPPPVELKESRPSRGRVGRAEKGSEVGAHAALLMTQDGFGAQFRFLQYAQPWMAVSQSLRYQSSANPEALYQTQYGLMLGLDLHPWKEARLSPIFTMQAGGNRFRRGLEQQDLNLFGFEGTAGLELKLARAASFLFQWSEVYYPGLQEQLFSDQKIGEKYAGSFQVFFKLRWEAAM